MSKTKTEVKTTTTETVKVSSSKKEVLITFLKSKLPTMFDRDPVLTGNVDKLADELLELL